MIQNRRSSLSPTAIIDCANNDGEDNDDTGDAKCVVTQLRDHCCCHQDYHSYADDREDDDDDADNAKLSKFIILISHVLSSPRVLVVNYDHINIIST